MSIDWMESQAGALVIERDGVWSVETRTDTYSHEGDLRLNGEIVAQSISEEPTIHRQWLYVQASEGDTLTTFPDGRITAYRMGESLAS